MITHKTITSSDNKKKKKGITFKASNNHDDDEDDKDEDIALRSRKFRRFLTQEKEVHLKFPKLILTMLLSVASVRN